MTPCNRVGFIAGAMVFLIGLALVAWAASGQTLLLPMTRYRIGVSTILAFGTLISVIGFIFCVRPHPAGVFFAILFLPPAVVFAIAYRPPDRGQEEFVFFPQNGRDKWVAMRVWSSPYDWLDQYMCPHPVFGVGCQPHVVSRHHTRDFDVTYHINADGFRVTPAAPANSPEVVFCGCSFTFGVGVNDDQVYPALLGQAAWPGIQVVNWSVSGWGTNACCLAVEKAIERSPKPALIVYPLIEHHLLRIGRRRSWHEKVNATLFPKFNEYGQYEGLVNPISMELMDDGSEIDKLEADIMCALLKRMMNSCAGASVPFVAIVLQDPDRRNLREILNQVPGLNCLWIDGECDRIYPHDSHPTPEGHLQLARAISRSPLLAEVSKLDALYKPDAFPRRFPHEDDYYLGVERPNSDSNARITKNGESGRIAVSDIVADGGKLRDTLLYHSLPSLEGGRRTHLSFEGDGEGVLEVRIMRSARDQTYWDGSVFSFAEGSRSYDFFFTPGENNDNIRLVFSLGGASHFTISSPLVSQSPPDDSLDLGFQLADPPKFGTRGQARLLNASTGHWRMEGLQSPEKVLWHVGLYKQPISLKKGKRYALSMRIRTDEHRQVYLGLQQIGPPYSSRGVSQSLDVYPSWKELHYEWVPANDSDDNKISLLLGSSDIPVEIQSAKFRVVEERNPPH